MKKYYQPIADVYALITTDVISTSFEAVTEGEGEPDYIGLGEFVFK